MTCREEVVAAFEVLGRRTGRVDFSPSEVLVQVRAGSLYKDSTVRTHVVAHMVQDGTLVRASPGLYRLSRHGHRPVDTVAPPASGERSLRVTEDAVKTAVAAWLKASGWTVDVRWGRSRGIDIDARRGTDRLIVEAKGEAPAGPQQVNYFLNALGELIQRMGVPSARYALALPDHPQYRGLVDRLPSLARKRMLLDVFFVNAAGNVTSA